MADSKNAGTTGAASLKFWVVGLTPHHTLEVLSDNEIDGHRAKIKAWYWMSQGRFTQAWLLQELEEIPPPTDDQKDEARRLFAGDQKKT